MRTVREVGTEAASGCVQGRGRVRSRKPRRQRSDSTRSRIPGLEPFPIIRNRKRLCKSLMCRVFEPENSDQAALERSSVGTRSRWDIVPLARLVAPWSRCGADAQASPIGALPLRGVTSRRRCLSEAAPERDRVPTRRCLNATWSLFSGKRSSSPRARGPLREAWIRIPRLPDGSATGRQRTDARGPVPAEGCPVPRYASMTFGSFETAS